MAGRQMVSGLIVVAMACEWWWLLGMGLVHEDWQEVAGMGCRGCSSPLEYCH